MTELSISCGAKVFNKYRKPVHRLSRLGQKQTARINQKMKKKLAYYKWRPLCPSRLFVVSLHASAVACLRARIGLTRKVVDQKASQLSADTNESWPVMTSLNTFNSIHVDDIKGHSMLCQSLDIRPNTIALSKRDKSYKMPARSLAKKCIQLNPFVHLATFQKLYQRRMFKVRCTTSSYNCLAWPGCQTFVNLWIGRYLKGSNTQYTVNIIHT